MDKELLVGDYGLHFTLGTGFVRYELSHTHLPKEDYSALKTGLFNSTYDHLEVRATLLDKPLIVGLNEPVHIAPKSHSHLSLSRPIAFQIVVKNSEEDLTLFSHAANELRLTCYGEITHPMVCYHSVSDILRPIENEKALDLIPGNHALVPLFIENQTKEPIELRKLILYRGLLKLYRSKLCFITNGVKVVIHSKSDAFIEYEEGPPSALGDLDLLFESNEEKVPRLLKRLRLRHSRGTGIEYGF